MKKKFTALLMVLLLPVLAGCGASGAATVQTTQELPPMAVIVFSGQTAEAEGEGVTIDGHTVTITAGGSYTLSGALDDGQIIVDAGKGDVVELLLNGVSITSQTGAAIFAAQSELLIITLAEGTENTLSDAASYVYDDAAEDEPDAALYAKDDVLIRGTGILTIYGNFQNGVSTKDNLVIDSATLMIDALNHGIRGKDGITIQGGTIGITAGNDGIRTANTLTITGGDITVNSLDDAIHAGQTAAIAGGTLTLLSRDDAIHADDAVNITGGTINIPACYEGIEGKAVNISGGVITMLAEDDGINAAGTGGSGDTGLQVNISGGSVTINSYGDGIDSNGTVTMSGGELYISGPLSSAYGALDYDNSFVMLGGVLAAAGSSGMAQTPGANSPQASVIVYFTQPQTAGNTYLLTDSDGIVLISHMPDKDFQCIVFSAPGMKSGSSYTLYESTDGIMDTATLLYDFTISGTITSVGGSYGQTTWMQNTQP